MNKSLFLFGGLIFFLVFSCKPGKKSEQSGLNKSWYEHLPPKTGYAFVFNENIKLDKFPSAVFNYYIGTNDKKFLTQNSFQAPFYIYILQKDDKLRSFVAVGISSSFNQIFNEKDGLYNGVEIYKNIVNKKVFYGIQLEETIFVSDSRVNLENIIRKENEQINESELFLYKKADRLLDHHANYNVIQLTNNLKPDVFSSSGFSIKTYQVSDIEAFDIIDSSKNIYTGIALNNEEKMMSIFKDIPGVDHEIYKFIPEGFTKVSRLSFDDFNGFYSRFTSFFNYQPLIKYTTKTIFQSLYSISYLEENFNKAVILQFEDASDFIKTNPYSGTYNGYDIYEVNEPLLLSTLFKPILPSFKASFFSISDDYIIITENQAYLKKLINDFENRNTLINRKDFESFSNLFPSDAQYEILKKTKLNNKNFYVYKNYSIDDENVYVNLFLQKQNSKVGNKGIEHLTTVSMDDTPIIKPQLIYNHKHKTYRIIYQNQDHELVYRDLSGQILWRKKFDNKIIGKIYPVDLYRNGKIQYAFVTKNKWFIIDRYGRNVEGFPVSFNNDITQSISVFDYDKNRKYRFGIVREKKFNLYDKERKIIKGFEYKPDKEIIFPAVHYRIGSKDYILIQNQDGILHILDRRGNIRIPIEEKFNRLSGNWKVYNKKFINLSKENEVYTIDLKGKVKKAKLNYDKSALFDAIPELFVAVTEDKLILNSKTTNIDLGNYLKPYIYKKKNGKISVFLAREDNRIYAFDKKGQRLPFSPITGQQVLDIKALGNKNYLLSYDSDKNLMIYRFK